MFKFQKTKSMLPSELLAYISTLESEITRQHIHIEELTKPNEFIRDGSTSYESETDLLGSLQIGEVIEASNIRNLGSTFKVKISEHRIDDYPTRMEAEHVAMLHNVKA